LGQDGVRGGKDHSLAQTLDHSQGADQLPAPNLCADGCQDVQDRADGQTREEHHLAAVFTGQLTRRHLGDHIAPEEAAQQQGFRLLRPVVFLKERKPINLDFLVKGLHTHI